MSDLIDRLSELRSQCNCFDESERAAYHTLSEAIEALQEQATLDDVSNAYENGYKQGKFETQQWIPCSERLPEDNKAVLGYAPKYNNIWAVYMTVNGEWMVWMPGASTRYNEDFNGEIIAWMPLPSPYKGDES